MISILEMIPYGHENAVKRSELVRRTGINDRGVRNMIMKERLNGNLIINLQDGKGYFRPILPEEIVYVRESYYAERGRHYTSGEVMKTMEKALGETA